MNKLKDMLQSISGELLSARLLLDSEWTAALTKRAIFKGTPLVAAVQHLALAQTNLEEARKLVGEVVS